MMPFTWRDGSVQELEVEWTFVEYIVEVNSNKELIDIVVKSMVDSDSNDLYYFDAFSLVENLSGEKLNSSNVSYILLWAIPAGENIEIPVFGAVRDSVIKAVHMVYKDSFNGNDNNNVQLQLLNKKNNELIATKTLTGIQNISAYKVVDFGPVNDDTNTIFIGESASFKTISNGTGLALPQGVLIIEWDIN